MNVEDTPDYGKNLESLGLTFEGLSNKAQDDVLNTLTTIRINTRVNVETKDLYYSEFEEVIGDFGEEETIRELTFLLGRKDSGSVERRLYLSLWYDMKVSKGLYQGVS